MDEWLLIRINRLGSWRDKVPNQAQCAKDLNPRAQEDKKSAWAHSGAAPIHPNVSLGATAWLSHRVAILGGVTRKALRRLKPMASRELQALALLLFHAKADNAPVASRIWVVSINRSAVDEMLVANEPDTHIIDAYDSTHRGVDTKKDANRSRAIESVLGAGYHRAYEVRDYTVDELKPLLHKLLAGNLLREEYMSVAKTILDMKEPASP